MDIIKTLQKEFGLQAYQVENTVKLIDEGNTIPFIARYRKELHGSMDDQLLREVYERLVYLRSLDERRELVRRTIAEQEKMTDEIAKALDAAVTLTEIEDIYRPFKPKRRTRATIAKEKGLEPLAMMIWEQKMTIPVEEAAANYLNPEFELTDIDTVIAGAKDIIAEIISDDPKLRGEIRKETYENGYIIAKGDPKKESVYEMYYDFNEPVKKIAGHRILAVNRGEREDFLKVSLEAPVDNILSMLYGMLILDNRFTKDIMREVVDDSYKRLISPSIQREIRNDLTEKAEDGAMTVFAENLRQLLLQPPVKDKVVMAFDPGFRTGCKVSVVDETGKVLSTDVVYCTPPQSKIEESKKKLIPQLSKFGVSLIAIGNGTASRETESFVAEMIRESGQDIYYAIVNEAGASVYSASKLGAQEFPDYDVALRSAVSIGRRLQDPLAELVKIDPKSIGVGQYQHDMNQKHLGETLGGVVESCVNNVGVDLNTASPSLLSYVAGINGTLARNIIEYREENGKFTSRRELLSVKKLGPKAYEQCAGFLRISEGNEPLDNTGVHPESYRVAEALLKSLSFNKEDVRQKRITGLKNKLPDLKALAENLGVGVPTLSDILKELEKPGRDPREDMPPVVLRSDVLSMEDLTEGMILQGTVRNVIDFGVFVDIGVHQDGLVHISQIADRYIKHPLEAVKLGDIVKVKVLSVDMQKKRISLTMKGII